MFNWKKPIQSTRFAFCCGKPLSEWFVSKGLTGWGMRCFFCERVWPFLTHAEFRETQSGK